MNMAHSPRERSSRAACLGSRVRGRARGQRERIPPNGSTRAVAVGLGERALFGKHAGTEVTLNGEEAIVLHEEVIAANLGH